MALPGLVRHLQAPLYSFGLTVSRPVEEPDLIVMGGSQELKDEHWRMVYLIIHQTALSYFLMVAGRHVAIVPPTVEGENGRIMFILRPVDTHRLGVFVDGAQFETSHLDAISLGINGELAVGHLEARAPHGMVIDLGSAGNITQKAALVMDWLRTKLFELMDVSSDPLDRPFFDVVDEGFLSGIVRHLAAEQAMPSSLGRMMQMLSEADPDDPNDPEAPFR
jgi:hypothetical protein